MTLDPIVLLIEAVVALMGLAIAINRKKVYGYFIALTFGIYVIYDANRFFALQISKDNLSAAFLIASISILIATWQIYNKAK